MSEAVEVLAASILAEPAPVLLPDTCCVLDIIRAAFRSGVQTDIVGATTSLTDRARQTPRSLWIVTPEQVAREWNDNSANVKGELTAAIRQTEQLSIRLAETAGLLLPNANLSPLTLNPLRLDDRVFDVAEQFLNAAHVLADHGDCISKAHTRLVRRIAPSSFQRQEYKDCLVIEHCLALCRTLRLAGFGEPLIFVTSNSTDYGRVPALTPPLDAEFAAVGLQYVSNLAWAKALL
jgi:hypothetical protein